MDDPMTAAGFEIRAWMPSMGRVNSENIARVFRPRARDEMTAREWNDAVAARLTELQYARRLAREADRERMREATIGMIWGVGLLDSRIGFGRLT